MNTETPPKRESHTGWIIAVGVLLLLAIAIPLSLRFQTPRDVGLNEVVLDLRGDPGGGITWSYRSDLATLTGVTNLPVKLVFRGRHMEFIAHRTNYTGPLHCKAVIDGHEEWGSLSTEFTSVRFLWSITTTNGVSYGFPSTP